MSLLLSLATRNLTRSPWRTVITGVAVAVAVALAIVAEGLASGLNEGILRTTIDTLTGHVTLRPPGASGAGFSRPIAGLEPVPESVLIELAEIPHAPRLEFDAWLVAKGDAMRARGIGLDPDQDAEVFPRERWAVDGAWPGAGEVMLGARVARLLEVEPGGQVVLRVRTAKGALNAQSFAVSGVATTRNPAIDNYAVVLELPEALSLTGAGGPSLIALRLPDREQAPAVAAALGAGAWEASTFHAAAAGMVAVNEVRQTALRYVIAVILAIAATGITNTLVMAVHERTREIGTLAAMGMGRGELRALFVLEGAMLGLAAASVGALIGGSANAWLAIYGFDFSSFSSAAGSALAYDTQVYTRFAWGPLVGALAFGVSLAALSGLWPAHQAASLAPAEAVRA